MAQTTNQTAGAMTDQVKGFVDAGRERASELTDLVKDKAGDAKDRLMDAGATVKGKLGGAKDALADAGGTALSATRGMIKEHPLIAVGVAFGLGYLVMRLMRN